MLIRVDADRGGIVDYLINGRKSGRDFTRDELDERVVLAGNIDVLDFTIQNFNGKGNKYKHYTLGFKEDEIPLDILEAISSDWNDFILSAYDADEVCIYTEAHLPRIKSIVDSRTGELQERKPHIHSVVPQVNLLDGEHLDPLGYFKYSQKYVNAFQQIINDKYGLSDPQTNRRIFTATKSETISWYKGDAFTGANRDIRASIFDEIIKRKIDSRASLHTLLKEFGTVREVNAGAETSYFNLKVPGSKKGINLKDYAFSSAFLSLSSEDKSAFLTSEMKCNYETNQPGRVSKEEAILLVEEWHTFRAKEVKYMNSGSKFYKTQYKFMSKEQKLAVLADREKEFYETYRGIDYDRNKDQSRTDRRATAFERIGDNLRSSSANLAAARRSAGNLDQGARNVADRTTLRAVAAIVAGRGGHQAADHANASFGERSKPGNAAGSLVSRYRYEHDQRQDRAKSESRSEFAEIKHHLDAARLLAYLSKSHGLVVQKYQVTKGQDGSERIRCGNQNLNVSDFLTKEMHLPWKEAAPILRDVYARQTGQSHYQAKVPPKSELWNHFREWKAETLPNLKADASTRIAADHTQALAKIRKDYNAYCSRIEGDRSITKGQAKLLKDIAKAEREHKKIEARTVRDVARLAYRAQWSGKGDHLYKRFLAESAQSNVPYAEEALAELRKRAPDVVERDDAAQYIRAADAQAEAQAAPIRRDLSYKVDTKGHVTYKIDGREALKDEGQRVKVLQATDNGVIEQGLALARSKFGKTITLHGSDDFKAQVVAVAVQKNMDVDFSDPHLQRMKLELQQQRQRERDQRARQIAAGKQVLADAAEKKGAAKGLKNTDADAEKAKIKPEKTQGEKPAQPTPIVPPMPAAPAHPVEGSQAPSKAHGTYTGEVVALTDALVYQQTKHGLIHHPREAFKKDVPEIGQVLKIKYNDKKLTSYKPLERDDTGLGL